MNPNEKKSSSRLAYAAAHVVVRKDKSREAEGKGKSAAETIDWGATLNFRKHLWGLGFGVAEAMDTAQRDLLGWDAASELIALTLAEACDSRKWGQAAASLQPVPIFAEVIAGAGTDGLPNAKPESLSQVISEYVHQGEFIQSRGGTVILLASPLMPKWFGRAEDYIELYTQVSRLLDPPLFVHWLGEMFAPSLAGYFPDDSFFRIMDANADRIRGVKISLLDKNFEIEARRRLRPNGQIVLTGDDFHYPELILGDGSAGGGEIFEVHGRQFPIGDFSHALLGIFDPIAPVAAEALRALDAGNIQRYSDLMEKTRPLALKLFEPPTSCNKAGVVFLAYLNGHQDHFALLGELERKRDKSHYAEILQLAEQAGVLTDLAEARRRFHALV